MDRTADEDAFALEEHEGTRSAHSMCALHPGERALATCDRCGNFMCSECVAPSGECTTCAARGSDELWANAERAARRLEVAIWVTLVATLGSGLSYVLQAVQVDELVESVESEALTSGELRTGLIALARVFVFVVAGVLWCVWMNRTNRALRATRTLEYGPNAWGWFFCPVLNLWYPYRVLAELYRASTGNAVLPSFFAPWWLMYLLSSAVGRASSKLIDSAATSSALEQASWIAAGSDVIDLTAIVLALQVVRSIRLPAPD